MVAGEHAGRRRRPVLLGATQVGVRVRVRRHALRLAEDAPVLRDDRSARRVGDVLEPLGDVPVVVDEVLVVVGEHGDSELVVAVEQAPEVVPRALRVDDGRLDHVRCPVLERLDVLLRDVLLRHPELRLRIFLGADHTDREDEAVDRLLDEAVQPGVAGLGPFVADLVLLHQHEDDPDHPARVGDCRQLVLDPVGEWDRSQRPQQLADRPRDEHVVALVHIRVAEVAVAARRSHERARAVQERIVAEDDGVTVDLEEHRPQVWLGAAEAVTLRVGEDVVERQSGPQWGAGHVDHLDLGQGWSVTLRSSTATGEAFHGRAMARHTRSCRGPPRIAARARLM